MNKKVIKKSNTEPGEFVSPIFARSKSDVGFCLNLNLKNSKINFKIIKIEIVTIVIKLVRSGMVIAKLDIKDAYYSIPIPGSHKRT